MAITNLFSTSLVRASSQYWSIAYTASLNPTSAFTYAGWFKLTTLPSSANYGIAGMFNGDGNSFLTIQDGGKLLAIAKVGGSQQAKLGNTQLTTGVWYHGAFTYDGSTFALYLNGVSDGTASFSGAVSTQTIAFQIGNSAAGSLFDGKIDDVRLWSRALSSTEIANLYSTPCTFSNGSGLLGWWQFENNGNDSSGGGFNLTNNNSATFTSDVPYSCTVANTSNFLAFM